MATISPRRQPLLIWEYLLKVYKVTKKFQIGGAKKYSKGPTKDYISLSQMGRLPLLTRGTWKRLTVNFNYYIFRIAKGDWDDQPVWDFGWWWVHSYGYGHSPTHVHHHSDHCKMKTDFMLYKKLNYLFLQVLVVTAWIVFKKIVVMGYRFS